MLGNVWSKKIPSPESLSVPSLKLCKERTSYGKGVRRLPFCVPRSLSNPSPLEHLSWAAPAAFFTSLSLVLALLPAQCLGPYLCLVTSALILPSKPRA